VLKRFLVAAVLIVFFGLVATGLWRKNGTVVAEQKAKDGSGLIKVRALQPRPFSINGLLGMDEAIYRCEYYRGAGEPLFSCQSFAGESFYPKKFEIVWENSQRATVILEREIAFDLVESVWLPADVPARPSGNSAAP